MGLWKHEVKVEKEEKLYFSQQQKHGIAAILNPTAMEQWLEPSL